MPKLHSVNTSLPSSYVRRGMVNAGTATLRVTFQGTALDVNMLLTPDIGDRCLIGLPDLKRFNIVTENFPCILPSNI